MKKHLHKFLKSKIWLISALVALGFVVIGGVICYFLVQRSGVVDPKDSAALITEARKLAKDGKNTEAIADYEKALEVDTTNNTVKVELANLYMKQKEYDSAAAELSEVTAANPSDSYALNSLGNSLRNQGKTAEAIDTYKKAIAGGNSDSVVNLVTLYNISGDYADSITLLNSELLKTPDDPILLQVLASTYSKKGDSKKAAEILAKIKK
ncbi:MAG: tetratricopeptide repeat protein [Candidatus Berkelbacteria bacterium]|nr:tetratricopeptide repeat protein [Candidatus Berkelbacteria bacterium]